MRFRSGNQVDRNDDPMPSFAAVGRTHFRIPIADEYRKPGLIRTGRLFSTADLQLVEAVAGSGLMTRPASATVGLPVADRWRVNRRPAVGRTAGSGVATVSGFAGV